jgi:hypothetical protein
MLEIMIDLSNLICFQDHDTADTYGMMELRSPWFIKPNKEEPP